MYYIKVSRRHTPSHFNPHRPRAQPTCVHTQQPARTPSATTRDPNFMLLQVWNVLDILNIPCGTATRGCREKANAVTRQPNEMWVSFLKALENLLSKLRKKNTMESNILPPANNFRIHCLPDQAVILRTTQMYALLKASWNVWLFSLWSLLISKLGVLC